MLYNNLAQVQVRQMSWKLVGQSDSNSKPYAKQEMQSICCRPQPQDAGGTGVKSLGDDARIQIWDARDFVLSVTGLLSHAHA
jgi:hypothetical protein